MSSHPVVSRTKKRWVIAGAVLAVVGGGALAFGQATTQPVQTLPADVVWNPHETLVTLSSVMLMKCPYFW
jgi:hypothetical protein